jgi:cephalosporin hydroxylase
MGLFTNRSLNLPDPNLNLDGTEFEVNNWIISQFVLDKLVPTVGFHPFPLNELMLMASTTCRLRPDLIFDWGTHIGKSARVFRETIITFGIPSHIHSIDLPDNVAHIEHPQQERGKLVRGLKEVTLHQGDGVSTALRILAEHPNAKALFYVDGDHSYESVKRELQNIVDQAPNAAVLLHDTFYQSASSKYNIGPHLAIQEVLSRSADRYRTLSTATGLPGMTLVYPRTHV